jgi:6,7-dimethyl-8-ribityllumazine synthase
MSGAFAPDLHVAGAEDLRVGVVASLWHAQVMDGLLAGALLALREIGIEYPTVVRVPGAFELSVATARLASMSYDAVVTLGVVIRGATPHFDYVCQAATAGLTRVSIDSGVPVGFGVLTCDDEQQALARAGLEGSREDKGRDAALAAVATAIVLRDLRYGGERHRQA